MADGSSRSLNPHLTIQRAPTMATKTKRDEALQKLDEEYAEKRRKLIARLDKEENKVKMEAAKAALLKLRAAQASARPVLTEAVAETDRYVVAPGGPSEAREALELLGYYNRDYRNNGLTNFVALKLDPRDDDDDRGYKYSEARAFRIKREKKPGLDPVMKFIVDQELYKKFPNEVTPASKEKFAHLVSNPRLLADQTDGGLREDSKLREGLEIALQAHLNLLALAVNAGL